MWISGENKAASRLGLLGQAETDLFYAGHMSQRGINPSTSGAVGRSSVDFCAQLDRADQLVQQ